MEPRDLGPGDCERRSLGPGARIVSADVDGVLWIKRGSAVAYTGDLKFHLDPVVQIEHRHSDGGPVRGALKRELVPLAKAVGKGRLLLTNDGQFNQIVRLDGETIYVAAQSLLAFEPSVEHELLFLGAAGALAGGLLVVRLSGRGQVVVSVEGESVSVHVTPDAPVSADPGAVVAWTSRLWPKLKTDLDAGSLIGHGGGQPIQLLFAGEGDVTLQARKHTDLLATLKDLVKSAAGL